MAQSRVTYSKGLNQDDSRSKYSPENYYYLLNGKVITETGLSSGSVTNEKGNTLSFTIPSTAPVYEITIADGYTAPSQLNVTTSSGSYLVALSGTTLLEIFDNITDDVNIQADITAGNFNVYLNSGRIVIVGLDDLISVTQPFGTVTLTQTCAAQTGLKICGWGTLENNIIVFTTESTDDAPINTPSQIWELEFDESTETITGLSGNSLVPSIHLKYNNILNLSLANRLGEVIGRYENTKIRSVYFTDDYNFLRSFNIANPDCLALAPQDLDVRADFTLSVPVYKSIGTGSLPIGSTVQVGYRLKTINGTNTIISPFSPPLPLGTDPMSGNYEDQKGAAFNTSGSRSVTYTIDNIDTSYGFIEHIAILYQNLDVPEVYIFKEEKVPLNGTLTVTHDYTEELLPLTLTELNVINHPFICKTITSKRNKLVAANIKYKKVKIDYDARAFRFLQNGTCELYTKQGVTDSNIGVITPANLSAISINEEADCINPFNDESGTIFGTAVGDPTTWESTYQYKYQSDGTTLGGEGKNVSYIFTDKAVRGFNNVPGGAPPFNSVSRDNATVLFDITDGLQTTNDGMYADFKSPLRSAYFKGYKRGEVYRFGIVFFDKKGTPSMVNWIGDIRFPEVHEFNLGSGAVASFNTNTLGIEFTVDISSVQNQISGFSIVRLEREEEDKTKLGTSLHIGFTNNTTDDASGLDGIFNHDVTDDIEINGTVNGASYFLQDNPSLGEANDFNTIFGLIFPKHQYNTLQFKNGDYLKEIGDYSTRAFCTYFDPTDGYTLGAFYRGYAYNSLPVYNRFLLDEIKTIDYLGHFPATDFNALSGDINTFINTSYAKDNGFFSPDDYTPIGLGNKKLVCVIDGTPPTGFSGNIKSNWGGGWFSAGTSIPAVGGLMGSIFRIKPLDYCRFLTTQYGGSSYESRASNTYISTGHYQSVDNTSSTTQTATVYGGDIFTLYNTDEYITMHWEATGNSGDFNSEPTNHKLSCAVGFPCETDLNLAFRHDNTWNDDQDFSGTWTKTPYSYHTAYSQNPNAVQQYVSPAIIDTDVDEHSHQIIASEEKIDGEAFDAWRIFKTNDLIEVDGIHGEINKIITFKDKVFFYQSRAIGQVSIQDRAITQDTTGVEVILGTGQVLDYYAYITTTTGTVHQFSVVATGSGIYHIDALSKKAGLLSDNPTPLSTIKGLSALFAEKLDGIIRVTDQPLWYNPSVTIDSGEPALGVHGVYDKRNSRVIWTILDGRVLTLGQGTKLNPYYTTWEENNTTITYNELIQSFESFKSFVPKLYLEHPNRFLSTDPDNMEDAYIHNTGDRCVFYGTTYDFKITVVINSAPELIKTLDNIEFLLDLKTSAGVDIPLETFNSIRVYNSYQDTGTLTLTPQANIIRTFRKWRMNVLRDASTNNPRLRDYHFFLELTYNNNSNKELILHDIMYTIRSSNY